MRQSKVSCNLFYRCMDGSHASVRCRSCSTPWSGTNLVIGTMYSYDVFASSPCCMPRINCKQCRRPVVDVQGASDSKAPVPPLKYFSEYSHRAKCPHCGVEDYHFVKSLEETFHVQKIITSSPALRIWSSGSVIAGTCLLSGWQVASRWLCGQWFNS